MMTMRRASACLMLAAALLAGACDDDGVSTRDVAQVEVGGDGLAVWAGDFVEYAARVTDEDGRPVSAPVEWSTSDTTIATVDATGWLAALRPGRVTVTARAGGRAGTAVLTVSGYELLYEARTAAGTDLFILPAEGGAPRRLLPAGMLGSDPAASADGLRIAFVVRTYVADEDFFHNDIWCINRDGSGLRQLTTSLADDDQPSWSRDGSRIAYRSRASEVSFDIWTMNAQGGDQRRLTSDPLPAIADEARPAWSPDGSRIAYASEWNGNMDIWTMKADGSDRRPVTRTPERDSDPAWSPDGSRIAFRRLWDGDSDLLIVNAAGGDAVSLVRAGFQNAPVWSPDGRMIAFTESAGPSDTPQLFTIRPDWTGLQQRTPAAGGANAAFLRVGPALN